MLQFCIQSVQIPSPWRSLTIPSVYRTFEFGERLEPFPLSGNGIPVRHIAL